MFTVRDYLQFLQAGLTRKRNPPNWPPDVFAIVAAVLLTSGAYCSASKSWPPTNKPKKWVKSITAIGQQWRRTCLEKRVPAAVVKWWRIFLRHRKVPLSRLGDNASACNALLQMLAAADEASVGAGIPSEDDRELDAFDLKAASLVTRISGGSASSLCETIEQSKLRVLPKTHTPQTGLTIRSFSHNLALASGELRPEWYILPLGTSSREMTLLLLPWPTLVNPKDFRPAPKSRTYMRNLPPQYGMFEYSPKSGAKMNEAVSRLFNQTFQKLGHIDGVILPEMSIPESVSESLASSITGQRSFLIAGVREERKKSTGNAIHFSLPQPAGFSVSIRQAKHHRWKLDKSQIQTYGLKRLSSKRGWWENMTIEGRCLKFVSMRPWLTTCVLLCEDLARPDPVGDVIRAVGPNLVIALLMDGPQLPFRWAGRHAIGLADDPGSSVLTLTCLGMSRISRPKDFKKSNSRVIGLWKDSFSGSVIQINMPARANSVLLSIEVVEHKEWTADGRSHGGATGIPVLRNVKYLRNGRTIRTVKI